MNIILYAGGLIIGIAAFIYLASLATDTAEVVSKKQLFVKKKKKPEADRKDTFKDSPINTIKPGLRMCPFCRVELSRDEPLYASRILDFDRDETKILIHGCRLCYKPEKPIERISERTVEKTIEKIEKTIEKTIEKPDDKTIERTIA